jgi:hypothetical protein
VVHSTCRVGLSVFPGQGVTNSNRNQLSWFHRRVAWELGQVAHGSARAWHLGRGARNTNVPKRVDPEHLSRMGKLVRWLNEDFEFFRVGACNIPAYGPVGPDQIRVTVAAKVTVAM